MCRTVWRVIASETCKSNSKVNSALDLLVSKSAGSRPEDRARAAAATLNQYYVDTNTTDYTAQRLRIALTYLSDYLGPDCGRSTSDAARDVTTRVMNHLEGGRRVAAIFCDLSRAFEMVDHNLLLEKLARYGVDGGFYSCLQSFLSNRKQSTCVSNIKSDFQPIGSCAVPQGSVMGNNMFIILVNDITSACRDVEYVMFADDTCILVSAPDMANLKVKLKLVMQNIHNWFTANGMMLNVDKTHIMQFKLRSCDLIDLNITLDGVRVPQATQVKYLGFIIDAGLSWTPHIDSLCDRLSSACYALSRLSHSLSEVNMKNAYYGYFHSVLTYGIVSWAMAADRERVLKLQKRAVRIVCKKPFDYPAKELFQQTKILTLTCAYILVAAKIIRKNISNIQTYAHRHNRNTRGRLQLYAPPKRLAKSRKSVETLGIKIYNALPDKIKNVESDKIFASQLKIKLQNMACFDLKEFFDEIGSST
ncbi:reverse transcriptase (RNA-dependent DNA polymerase) domain-containing protein [Phthorimaea operculella]|nr:reverse transcriptase (RNA-dependent DNA polymerase) domain-containing protein [Phthorimaea operculella]